jgi:hypothetical protein
MVHNHEHTVEPREREQAPQQARRFRQSQRSTRCSSRHSQQINKCNYACDVNEAEPGRVDNDISSRLCDGCQPRSQAGCAAGIQFSMKVCHGAIITEQHRATTELNHLRYPIRQVWLQGGVRECNSSRVPHMP